MRIAIVAGEPSGDLLAAELIQALQKKNPTISFEGITGPKMKEAGCKTLFSIEDITGIGLTEIIKQLPRILKIRRRLIKTLLKNPPDIYIGIDAPDFNLPIELKLKKAGIQTVHYNSPSIWAWRPKRIFKIKKAVDLMLTLFPFEAPIYEKHRIPVKFIGHPLADRIPFESNKQEARKKLKLPEHKRIIALLPGSRSAELNYLGKLFLEVGHECLIHHRDLIFISAAPNAERRQQLEADQKKYFPLLPLTVFEGQSQEVMAAADVILLASGTATLEGMLIKRPLVVAYRMAFLTYWILKRLVITKYISLPNLIADQVLIPEFIQNEANVKTLAKAVLERLENPDVFKQVEPKFQNIHQQLKLNASEQAAEAIINM